jgi:hypothetical protein
MLSFKAIVIAESSRDLMHTESIPELLETGYLIKCLEGAVFS